MCKVRFETLPYMDISLNCLIHTYIHTCLSHCVISCFIVPGMFMYKQSDVIIKSRAQNTSLLKMIKHTYFNHDGSTDDITARWSTI